MGIAALNQLYETLIQMEKVSTETTLLAKLPKSVQSGDMDTLPPC